MRVKKWSVTVAVLMMLFMTTAIGYAAWTQEIQLNATVATGNFDVIYTDATNDSGDADTGALTTTISNNNHLLTIDVQNLKPGEKYTSTVTVQNIGSIKALLESVTVNDYSIAAPVVLEINGSAMSGSSFSPSAFGIDTLEVSQSDTFTVSISMPYEATNGQDQSQSFSVSLNFVQALGANA